MEEFSYIVLDLEWNQTMSGQETITRPFRFDSEIIEIGALKLNNRFEEMSEFKSFVRPVFYPSMNGHVVQLTKIRPIIPIFVNPASFNIYEVSRIA